MALSVGAILPQKAAAFQEAISPYQTIPNMPYTVQQYKRASRDSLLRKIIEKHPKKNKQKGSKKTPKKPQTEHFWRRNTYSKAEKNFFSFFLYTFEKVIVASKSLLLICVTFLL